MIFTNNGQKTINFISLLRIIIFIAFSYEVTALLFSVGTISFILLFRKSVSGLPTFIGTITYPIYLIHFPIGVKFVNLLKPRINLQYYIVLFIVTLLLIIAVSWVFYKVFEEFSEGLSKKLNTSQLLLNPSSG